MTDFGGREIAGRDVGAELFVSSRKSRNTKGALIKEYADGYGSLTDEQADSLIQCWLDSAIGKRCKGVEYLSRLF
jgi:hypothetical protein